MTRKHSYYDLLIENERLYKEMVEKLNADPKESLKALIAGFSILIIGSFLVIGAVFLLG